MSKASRNKGYKVPNNTINAATTNRMLFINNKVSLDCGSKAPVLRMAGARQANSARELPTTTNRKPRMNTPRVGSAAKECTEVNTPERTRKAPSRLREKAKIARNTVQALNIPRFSVTAKEWIKAVPTSQGMNEAFSTGSQNHQPPQPSS